jgi:hypothetical protein
MVYAPERLVFEGPPILIAPLAQDQAARQPRVFDGPPLDTKEVCPPLRISELTEIAKLKAQAAHVLAPERAKARDKFISQQADQLASRTGISSQEARRIVARQCAGVLLPDVVLRWDDSEFDGCTVGDILKDPERFVGATLADPLEGPAYGRCKAIVMRRPDGQPWLKSFAHGHTTYELRYDARAAAAALAKASKSEASHVFVAIAVASDLDPAELEELRNEASALSGITKRALDAKLKAATQKQASQHARAERERKAAERRDPRPAIPAPPPDAPWIPQMEALNDILGASKAAEPPMRDVEGVMTQVRVRCVPSMHALTANGANGEETDATIQPPPTQSLLTRLTEMALAEMIERHIDYVHPETGDSVHLSAPFV